MNNNAFYLYMQCIIDKLSIFSLLFAGFIWFQGTMVSVALLVDLFLMQFIDSQYVKFRIHSFFVLCNSLEDMTQERPSSPQKVRVVFISTLFLLFLLLYMLISCQL